MSQETERQTRVSILDRLAQDRGYLADESTFEVLRHLYEASPQNLLFKKS